MLNINISVNFFRQIWAIHWEFDTQCPLRSSNNYSIWVWYFSSCAYKGKAKREEKMWTTEGRWTGRNVSYTTSKDVQFSLFHFNLCAGWKAINLGFLWTVWFNFPLTLRQIYHYGYTLKKPPKGFNYNQTYRITCNLTGPAWLGTWTFRKYSIRDCSKSNQSLEMQLELKIGLGISLRKNWVTIALK